MHPPPKRRKENFMFIGHIGIESESLLGKGPKLI